MPSIANQDFKIYGRLGSQAGIPAKYCGELYAALIAKKSFDDDVKIADGFVVISTGDGIARMVSPGVYYDMESGEWEILVPNHYKPGYYEALWAIQLAEYSIGIDNPSYLEFSLMGDNEDMFAESTNAGMPFMSEDGYIIKGTKSEGKLSSLYLGERVDDPTDYIPIHFESLLPLVGELPLGTTEIW